MLPPAKQTKKIHGAIIRCRHGFTSTSHIKIQKFVQNNNCKGHRSKHFVIDTHYQVSCVGL
ncbi:hypothetical protein EVY06_16800 [Citrobacter koseri]|nr:hypothetical protein CO700_15255 [Citrobacter koseri]AVE69523.1 hypothetical protein AM351_17765 [Citrobacter koseri]PNN12269.1 hypothetical protein AL526_005845 [Citrobacter koseri]PWY11799.1 hypothetical protein DL345_20315 [Citrobacter koseri]RZA98803.1 hypothetical protein EVY06_16800 [Citrobacter koseri]